VKGGTLVVCPTSLLHQWAREIGHKVHPAAACSVHVYHSKVCLSVSVGEGSVRGEGRVEAGGGGYDGHRRAREGPMHAIMARGGPRERGQALGHREQPVAACRVQSGEVWCVCAEHRQY
jgi:hypothetical protein